MNCVCFPPINTSPHGSYWIGNWKVDTTECFVQNLEVWVCQRYLCKISNYILVMYLVLGAELIVEEL